MNFEIIRLESVDSTNDFAKSKIEEFSVKKNFVIVAKEQTNGRGQRGNLWFSEKGKNITCSIAIFFDSFLIENQFYISKVVSISIINALSFFKSGFEIKWPNDIYFEKKKIAGILIENSISGKNLNYSIIGIGLNVNQEIFENDLEKATSLKNIISKNIDPNFLFELILKEISILINLLEKKMFEEIDLYYFQFLMNYKILAKYSDNSGVFKGKIIGIENSGHLIIEKQTSEIKKYDFKEIVFL